MTILYIENKTGNKIVMILQRMDKLKAKITNKKYLTKEPLPSLSMFKIVFKKDCVCVFRYIHF